MTEQSNQPPQQPDQPTPNKQVPPKPQPKPLFPPNGPMTKVVKELAERQLMKKAGRELPTRIYLIRDTATPELRRREELLNKQRTQGQK